MSLFVSFACLLALCGSAVSWTVSRSPSMLDMFGAHAFTDVHNTRQGIYSSEPGCETFAAIYSAGPFPLGENVFVTVITDPEHDKWPSSRLEGNGCVNCPNGCCVDQYDRVSWRYINGTVGEGGGTSDNFCVPKGFRVEDDTDCDPMFIGTGPDGQPHNWCQKRVQACPGDDSKCNPDLVKTDCPEADKRPINPDCKQADCLFAHEVFVTNTRPTACNVEPFLLGQHELDSQGKPIQDKHWTVTIAGSDADVPPDGLVVYYRTHVRDCAVWNSNLEQYEATKVVASCDAYHALGACKLDDGAPTTHSADGPFWIDEEFGIAHHCAGHKQTECSAKHFKGSDTALQNHCRVIGCWPSDAPANGRACDYCELLLSANFLFNASIRTPEMQNPCVTPQDKDHFTVVISAMGFPSDTASDAQTAPNKCCDSLAHQEPMTLNPTPSPTPGSSTDPNSGTQTTNTGGTGGTSGGTQKTERKKPSSMPRTRSPGEVNGAGRFTWSAVAALLAFVAFASRV